MSDQNRFATQVSRREAMKTALKAGAYAAPVILSATIAGSGVAAATPPPITGALTGSILDAITGVPVVGATVAIGTLSTVTNRIGVYTLANVPAGVQTVTTSAAGFANRTDAVTIAANTNTTFTTGLVPLSAASNVTIVLTWDFEPADLDAHLSGPDVINGGRFEAAFFDPSPVPYVSLSMDVVTGFGPETDTIRTYTGGVFVPGEYHFWVENYSGEGGYIRSNARANIFQGGAQIAQFMVNNATGDPGAVVWYVCNVTLTATVTGQIIITPVQQFIDTPPVAPRKLPPKKTRK